MKKVTVDVSGKQDFTWPKFCVLCLKPNPEEEGGGSCGDKGWSIPYCRDCFAKVTRLQNWGEDLALFSAVGVGWIAGVIFLADKIRSEGWEVLLCLDGDVWGMAILVGGMAAFAVWLVIILAAGVLQPRLPSLFPNRYSWPGADVTTGTRKKVLYPTPDTKVETEEIILEEVEFTNPEYAEKFCKANGFDKLATGGLEKENKMGILAKLLKRKSFDELMDEYYGIGQDYIDRRIDEKALLAKQRRILKRAARAAKDDKQKITVNACIMELEKRAQAVQAGVVRK